MVIKNNQVTEEIFTICERKLSHTRHLQVWHDNSTIANNGYFIVTINTCYDKNILYTREEYKEKTGIDINVQADIEKTQVHILTKTSSCSRSIIT